MSRAKWALAVPLAMAANAALSAMLLRSGPRPFGLSNPGLTPAMLSSASQTGFSRFISVHLCYGQPLTIAGSLIEVETCFSRSECDLPALQQIILRAEFRDQAWARKEWEDIPGPFTPAPEVRAPADAFERRERVVFVAGQEHRVPVLSHGSYEALRFDHDSMVVTAVARAGFPGTPRFDVVADLKPYLAGQRRFFISWLRFWEL